jgi:transcriptional/translational regulatory protein YebC/TACO1
MDKQDSLIYSKNLVKFNPIKVLFIIQNLQNYRENLKLALSIEMAQKAKLEKGRIKNARKRINYRPT